MSQNPISICQLLAPLMLADMLIRTLTRVAWTKTSTSSSRRFGDWVTACLSIRAIKISASRCSTQVQIMTYLDLSSRPRHSPQPRNCRSRCDRGSVYSEDGWTAACAAAWLLHGTQASMAAERSGAPASLATARYRARSACMRCMLIPVSSGVCTTTRVSSP